jgi:predicted metalloprotease
VLTGRRFLAALAGTVLLAGCTSFVAGSASPADGSRTDARDADPRVQLAEDGETDRTARNALADVLDYWEQTFPATFGGRRFPGVRGGFWSIDPDVTDAADLPESGCFAASVAELADNAFYCASDDAVYYDRAWLTGLAEDYGPYVIAEIMAHELGHAVQQDAGIDGESIVVETQAECFAGAWTRWVVDGHSRHVTVRLPALDPFLLGYLYFADAAGSAPEDAEAHGSLFDQLSAFQDGYDDGLPACLAFGPERLYTEAEVDARDEPTGGDLPFAASVGLAGDTLDAFWRQVFAGELGGVAAGRPFAVPDIRAADGPGAVCGGTGEERDLQFCPADGSVRYDAADLLRPAYAGVGDFAVDTLLSLPYGMAVRSQLGRSTGDPAAATSVVCASGWYTRQLYDGAVPGVAVELSPGDVDEAAVVLLEYATRRSVLPDAGLTGFELVDSFRQGFVDGGSACRLGG